MRLDEEQTEVIKAFIHKCGINYEDISSEICDHMCSQIEDLMDNGLSFETGFEKVRQRWHLILRKESSIWMSSFWSRPRIVLMKSEKIIKKIYLQSLVIGVLTCSFLYLLVKTELLTPSQLFKGIFISNIILVVGAFYTWMMLYRSRYKTVYSFVFNSKLTPLMSLFFLYIWSTSEVSVNQVFWILLILTNVSTIHFITTAWKHFGVKRAINVA